MADRTVDGRRDGRRRLLTVLPWVVVGAVMVALAAVAVVRLFMTDEEPGEAVTVQDVADVTVEVTETLDLDAGLALLCEAPMELYPRAVMATVEQWRAIAGTDDPEVSAETSDVDAGAEGSFVVVITSPDDALSDVEEGFRVFVEDRGDRSCITGVGGVGSERPTTRFSRDGYSPVTSPPPSPRPSAPPS